MRTVRTCMVFPLVSPFSHSRCRRPAEEGGAPRAQRRVPCVAIHVRDHQHLRGCRVLHHRGDQPVVAEARFGRRSQTHLHAVIAQVLLGLRDRVRVEVEDRRRQHGVAPPSASASTRCSRCRRRRWRSPARRPASPPPAVELEVVAGFGAVAVHRGEQDLARAELARPRAAHSTASSPVGVRPPWCTTSPRRPSLRRASIATTTHWRRTRRRLADQRRVARPPRC